MADQLQGLDPAAFRSALAQFPSGVTIVTTRSDAGTLHGFTASSFAALSLDPPLVLVCLDRGADCFPVFMAAKQFVVNIVTDAQSELAIKFATKGENKFAYGNFEVDEAGHPLLPDAAAVIRCELEQALPGGDHVILIGRVHDARTGSGKPVTWYRGDFLPLGESAA
ncbi:flavin reductase family protein [Streptomyces sp. NPDC057651]|jgi:flavin reductase ActVB|uniref:flavin reductase family protein n=1 Tax=unclassified Streptomyces TaxID=2593676 RepID=UPI0022508BFF|nr:flavin reductase family protein [Streptomyces sp. NBC_00063]MCX5443838.1 flavin reductase family protein [Streptomyces sp. NBC_00063]